MLNLVMMYYVRSRWARLAGWLFIQFGELFCSSLQQMLIPGARDRRDAILFRIKVFLYPSTRADCASTVPVSPLSLLIQSYVSRKAHAKRRKFRWEMSAELDQEAHQAPVSSAFVVRSGSKNSLSQKDKVRAELASSMPFLFEGEDNDDSTNAPQAAGPSSGGSQASDETAGASNTTAAAAAAGTTAEDKKPLTASTANGQPPRTRIATMKSRAKKYVVRPRWTASWRSTEGKRMPIFGPERVVEDPYIKEKHKKQVVEILIVGAVFVFVFEAAMVAIPEKVPL